MLSGTRRKRAAIPEDDGGPHIGDWQIPGTHSPLSQLLLTVFRNIPKINPMQWIRQNWTLCSILILVVGAGWITFSPPPQALVTGGKIPAPQEGFLAPDFTLPDAQGKPVRLSDLRGKPVLLNLWASWCPPCQVEMPDMEKVYQDYAAQGFTILAVDTTYQDEKSAALKFAQSKNLTFPILFDLDGETARKYQVRAMPTSFFIDKEGIIRKVVIGGPMPESLLRAEAERLIEER
jgi:cytochrome c biogenesis protein CcmG, thiol:disulfide interchange protein DsbE